LLEAIEERSKARNKEATGVGTAFLQHGPGGLLATAGVDPVMFSTRVRPAGLLDVLPAYPSVYVNPLYTTITGFLGDGGSDPATACDSCMTGGVMKACTLVAQFGRYCRQTKELELTRLGKLNNRAEPTDLRLINDPFMGNTLTPGGANLSPLRSEMAQAIVELGISFENLLSRQLWTGNPANNNVGGGYRELPGLEILVSTGKVDALDGTSCPSLDSDIKDYNYQEVCSGSPSIVETLTYMFRYISKLARTTGMDPVDLRWVMREELFYELTSCWPCSYMSFRCSSNPDSSDITNMVEASEGIRMRDAMRNGNYLLVDGRQIPVILDDGIPEDTNVNNANLQPGEFSSDIYLLPFSARGIATLYLEYFDYNSSMAQLAGAPAGPLTNAFQVTDGGKFAWAHDVINYCFVMNATIEPRVLLRTPHLAGRLQNVMYSPLQHTRTPFPGDGYFKNGGRTTTTPATYYSEWREQA
jgi:hypothetical protein